MSETQWSWLLASTTLLTYVLAGRPPRRAKLAAWWVTILGEPLWLVYGYRETGTVLNGFSVQAVFFVLVAVWNLATLRRESKNDMHRRPAQQSL